MSFHMGTAEELYARSAALRQRAAEFGEASGALCERLSEERQARALRSLALGFAE